MTPDSEEEDDCCNCSKPMLQKGCLADRCATRMLFIECNEHCPAGERCDNQRMQRHEWAPIEIFQVLFHWIIVDYYYFKISILSLSLSFFF